MLSSFEAARPSSCWNRDPMLLDVSEIAATAASQSWLNPALAVDGSHRPLPRCLQYHPGPPPRAKRPCRVTRRSFPSAAFHSSIAAVIASLRFCSILICRPNCHAGSPRRIPHTVTASALLLFPPWAKAWRKLPADRPVQCSLL
jgi:hypothetical protein